MKKYFKLLKTVDLFDGIEENELMSLLACLSAKAVKYEKGQTIFNSGDNLNRFGIVLSGEVQIALSLCHFCEHTDPDAIRGLQRIDLITQALEDLGRQHATGQICDIGRQQHPLFAQGAHDQAVLDLERNVQPTKLKAKGVLDLHQIPSRARIDRNRHPQHLPIFIKQGEAGTVARQRLRHRVQNGL